MAPAFFLQGFWTQHFTKLWEWCIINKKPFAWDAAKYLFGILCKTPKEKM